MLDSLKDTHYKELCRLVQGHTGIQLPPAKRSMLEGRLRKRSRILGLDSLKDYGALLFEGGELEKEFSHLADNVTTNKTDFYREPDHFDFLSCNAIPALLSGRDRGARLKLWSAASSTGAEAYTIAMVLAGMQGHGTSFSFSILGTDISNAVLAQARRAVFPVAMLDMIPPAQRERYVMLACDKSRQEFRIVPELRRLVRFEQLNLMDQKYPFDSGIDVIFCRNVLIYFAKTAQQDVLRRLTSHLRPGGYLILGHSESFAIDSNTNLIQVAPTVFMRLDSRRYKERAA